MTINEISEEFFDMKRREVRVSTLSSYMTHFINHIANDEIAGVPMDEIAKVHLQSFVYRLQDKGLSGKTIHDVVIIVNMVREYAEDMHDIPAKTIRGLKYPQGEQAEVEIMSVNEMKRMTEYILNNPDPTTVPLILCLHTGLRIGELSALQWRDIDFAARTVSVSKTLQRVRMVRLDYKPGEKFHSEIQIGPTKTRSSKRTIPITPALVKLLKQFRGLSPDDYFVVGNGAKPKETRLLRNYFNRLLDTVGIPRKKFHALRHTFASMMITNGADIVTTSKLLGHSDVSTTLNVYSHSNEEKKREAVQMIGKKLKLLSI